MMKTVKESVLGQVDLTTGKRDEVLKRKRSSLLVEGISRRASTSRAGDLPKQRKLSKSTVEKGSGVSKRKRSASADGRSRRASTARAGDLPKRKLSKARKSTSVTEQGTKETREDGKGLRKSRTVILEKGKVVQLKSAVDEGKTTPGIKSHLELKREALEKITARKSSAGSTQKVENDSGVKKTVNEPKAMSGNLVKMKPSPKEPKTKQPEKPETPLRVVRSEDLKTLTKLEQVSPELHEERMAALRQIVTQAELDRRIFCMFDRRRHVTIPIREELIKRGWEEYQPKKGTVLRKNRSSPPKITSTAQLKRSATQDTVTQNPTGTDRTRKAMFPSSGNKKALYVSSPVEKFSPVKEIKDVFEYGISWEMVLSPTSRKRISSPRSPAELSYMSQYIEENNIQVAMAILSSKPEIQLPYFSYVPDVVNKFQKTSFCTKYGLWMNLKRYSNLERKYPVLAPRMYNLGDRESCLDFTFDYYATTTTSILRWLVFKIADEGISSVSSKTGKVPVSVFKFAIKKTKLLINYLVTKNPVSRDIIMRTDANWRKILLWFYELINEQEKITIMSAPDLYVLYGQAVEALRILREIKPDSVNDGMTNLWIVKPYSASCGRGIFMTNNFYYLEQLEQKRYIIQKYIERPFLINKTKFDIRQWFLVTSLVPLQIWTYKECYLRFCSVPFNLHNLHESLHLTNNAIQRKYAKFVGLPYQNMWDSNAFRRYLRETGYPNIWEERIYPGMRQALIAALLCSESTFDTPESKFPPRNGWFELYGADFMLTENLQEGPWLIEINENPALDPSTPVTGNLCPKMLRDVVKVVVDWRSDPQASTGEWELAFSGKKDG